MVNILVVDDEVDVEPMIRQRFRREIRAGRVQLHFAHDGIDALEIMEKTPDIALVITDIKMPRMDGLTLLERLADRSDIMAKSIIVSAYGDIANIRAGMNRGAFDFITKPISFEDLDLTIKRALDKGRMERLARDAHLRVLEVQKEFEWARRVQRGILPRPWPKGGPEELTGFMQSAQEVAGDSYDFIPIDDDHVGFAIADVAGKGIAAAMMASITHALLRALANDFLDPAECLGRLNRLLTAHNPEMLFVTMLYGVLNRRTGVISYANAGHPWPLRLNASGEVTTLSGKTGIPVGIKESAVWTSSMVTLQPGEGLFLYTDGLTETSNAAGEWFGAERMTKRLQGLATAGMGGLIPQLIASLDEFRGKAAVLDDITCLFLHWRGCGEGSRT